MRKTLFLLLVLAACGDQRIDVRGNVTVTHRIEIATDLFVDYCTELYPNDKNAQSECVSQMVSDFLATMGDFK